MSASMSSDNTAAGIPLEGLLEYTSLKGFGYPLAQSWVRIDSVIRRETGGSNWTFPRLCNPLILDNPVF